MKKKKGGFTNFLLVMILVMGLSLVLYPPISSYWNSKLQSRVIANYTDSVASMDEEEYNKIWYDAIMHNKSLLTRSTDYGLSDEQKEQYDQLLNVAGNGIMGYIEIPSIHSFLAVYHGTSDSVLQIAVGHLDWSSLPTGGENTHCVLSGHRGLPSARLFTDLDQLREGDVFMLHILDETLTYEVDQILIVLPNEVNDLVIEEGKDLCTLVTCTPYGVNSHRLLVRGHRIENAAEAVTVRVTSDAYRLEPMAVAAVLFFPILILMLTLQALIDRRKK